MEKDEQYVEIRKKITDMSGDPAMITLRWPIKDVELRAEDDKMVITVRPLYAKQIKHKKLP